MTNPQIFIQGIIKTWWLWAPALIGILWTGLSEAVNKKWDKKNDRS